MVLADGQCVASGPDGELAVQLAPLWNGEAQRGERVLRDVQALGTPLLTRLGPMTYPDMLAPVDAMLEQKDGCYWGDADALVARAHTRRYRRDDHGGRVVKGSVKYFV